MRVDQLIIDKKIVQFSQTNRTISKKNSVGKTTLIRYLLFAMGFQIPSTKGMNFQKTETRLDFTIHGNKRKFIRKDQLVDVYEDEEFIQTVPVSDGHTLGDFLFEITDSLVLQNILATLYFDQEKGWTLLNRGRVIGAVDFNIEELIEGITTKQLADYNSKINQLRDNIDFYRKLERIVEASDNLDRKQDDFDWDSQAELEDSIRTTKIEETRLNKQISQLETARNSNVKLLKMIENFGLSVRDSSGEEIRVTEDNIIGYNFNQAVLNARLTGLKNELRKVTEDRSRLEQNYRSVELVHMDSKVDRFRQALLDLQMTPESVHSILTDLRNDLANLRAQKREIISLSPEVMDLYNLILKYCTSLGVQEFIDTTPNFIFTNNLKRYSGAVLHLIVFGYRLALHRLVENTYHIKLPIILDSPSAGELDELNFKKMLKLIDQEFPNDQLIVASINRMENAIIKWTNSIEMKKSLMESLENLDGSVLNETNLQED